MKTLFTVLGVIWFLGGASQLVISIWYHPAYGFAVFDLLVAATFSTTAIALIKGEK